MKTKIVVCVALVAVIAAVVCAVLYFGSADFPDHGVWYCEELNMTLSREPGIPSTCEVNGELQEVELYIYMDLHTFYLAVPPDLFHGVFTGYCKRVNEERMIITDMPDRSRYTFVRQFVSEDQK